MIFDQCRRFFFDQGKVRESLGGVDKDIYTPTLVIHFFDQCFGIELLSDIRPTEDNGYSEILLYLGACDKAGLFVYFRDRDGCALARKPSRRAVTKSSSPACDPGDLTLESLHRPLPLSRTERIAQRPCGCDTPHPEIKNVS